jgi:hypothetical protein
LSERPAVKVLYIVGAARSGSTILDNVLGEIDGVFSAGEIRFLWQRVIQGRVCGCGLHLDRCPVWSRVLASLSDVPSLAGTDTQTFVAWQRRALRLHHTFRLLGRHGSDPNDAVASLVTAMESVYTSLATVTSARVIVDSSGRASDGALLRLVRSVQPFFVHLVRDPRGMVYSQRHRKLNPDRGEAGALEATNPALSSLQWSTNNITAEALCRREPHRSMRMRYEDFVADPRAAIATIVERIGERADRLPFVGARRVELGLNHAVSGNPSRFQRGQLEVKLDNRWVTEMTAADRRMTTALLWPLMRHYGYPLAAPKA